LPAAEEDLACDGKVHHFRKFGILCTARKFTTRPGFKWKSNLALTATHNQVSVGKRGSSSTERYQQITRSHMLCGRFDCLYDLVHKFRQSVQRADSSKRLRADNASAAQNNVSVTLPHPRNDRVRTSEAAVLALLQYLQPYGSVVDVCGSVIDQVCRVLSRPDYNCAVCCNDIDKRLVADTHVDICSDTAFDMIIELNGGCKFDFAISSPPYSNEKTCLRAVDLMRQVSRVGCAAKLSTTFLHPTLYRHQWLLDNPPTSIIYMRDCDQLSSGHSRRGEVWVVWMAPEFITEHGVILGQSLLRTFNFVK
jgi:hypothetical protein